jgi:hypothetical protein
MFRDKVSELISLTSHYVDREVVRRRKRIGNAEEEHVTQEYAANFGILKSAEWLLAITCDPNPELINTGHSVGRAEPVPCF